MSKLTPPEPVFGVRPVPNMTNGLPLNRAEVQNETNLVMAVTERIQEFGSCQEADAWAELRASDPARKALIKAEHARQTATQDAVGRLLACSGLRQHNTTTGLMGPKEGNS